MKKALSVFDRLIEWIIFVSSFGFVVLCFLQVFCRFVLNNSISWSEEASRYLFVIVVFLGGIVCVKEKRHTGVDLLLEKLPFRAKRSYQVVVYALMFVFSVYLMVSGWRLAMGNMGQISSALRIPLGYIYMFIPISGLFMALNCIRVAIQDWTETYAHNREELHQCAAAEPVKEVAES